MNRLVRNILWYAGSDAGSRVITFLVAAYIARVLGPSSFGLISIGFSVLGYLLLLSSPAVQLVETRNVAAGGEGLRDRVGGVLIVRLFLSLLLCAFTAIATFLVWPAADGGLIVFLFSLSLVPSALTAEWYFQGSERFSAAGVARLLQALLYAVLVVVFVGGEGDVLLVPLSFLGGLCAAAVYLGLQLMASPGRPRWHVDLPMWRRILRENTPIGLSVFFAQQVTSAPPLVLAAVLSTADVGVYSAAARLLSVLLFVDRLLNALFLPAVTRVLTRAASEVKAILAAILRVVLALLLPLAAVVAWLAPSLMELAFEREFTGGASVLRILAVYALLTVINSVFVCTLVGAGGERAYARIVTAGAVLLILLLVLFTLGAGMDGAAAAVAAAEALVLGWMVREAGKRVQLPRVNEVLRPVFAAPGLAAGPLVFPASPVAAALAGIGLYAGTLLLIRGVSLSDIRLLRQL